MRHESLKSGFWQGHEALNVRKLWSFLCFRQKLVCHSEAILQGGDCLVCIKAWPFYVCLFIYLFYLLINFIFTLIYFTILYWFCHTLTWICHRCTWVPNPDPPLPPPTPYHLSGSSPCTSPKHPVSCIEHWLVLRFLHDSIHVSMPFSQIIPPSPSPSESKSPFYTSVSLLLSRIQGYHYYLSKFHICVLIYCIGVFLSGLLHSV